MVKYWFEFFIQGIALKAKYCEFGKLGKLLGELADRIVIKIEYFQPKELSDLWIDVSDVIIR